MPSGSLQLPPAVLALMGEVPAAVKAAREELKAVEKEIISAARAGRQLDDARYERATVLRREITEWERTESKEKVNIASLRRDILDVRGLIRDVTSGQVGLGTMRDLRDTLSLGARGLQMAGFGRGANALAGATGILAGPVGMVAGMGLGLVTDAIQDADKSYRARLAEGDRDAAFTRRIVSRAGSAGDVGAREAERLRAEGLRRADVAVSDAMRSGSLAADKAFEKKVLDDLALRGGTRAQAEERVLRQAQNIPGSYDSLAPGYNAADPSRSLVIGLTPTRGPNGRISWTSKVGETGRRDLATKYVSAQEQEREARTREMASPDNRAAIAKQEQLATWLETDAREKNCSWEDL